MVYQQAEKKEQFVEHLYFARRFDISLYNFMPSSVNIEETNINIY